MQYHHFAAFLGKKEKEKEKGVLFVYYLSSTVIVFHHLTFIFS